VTGQFPKTGQELRNGRERSPCCHAIATPLIKHVCETPSQSGADMNELFPFSTVRRSVGHVVAAGRSVALSVAPHGGQRSARRNALSAILDNEVAARARRHALDEAERAINETLTRQSTAPAVARAI
jgi:hypothetical protein